MLSTTTGLRALQFASAAIVLGCGASQLCVLAFVKRSPMGELLDAMLAAMNNPATVTSMVGRFAYMVAIASIGILLSAGYLLVAALGKCLPGEQACFWHHHKRLVVFGVMLFDTLIGCAWMAAGIAAVAGWTCNSILDDYASANGPIPSTFKYGSCKSSLNCKVWNTAIAFCWISMAFWGASTVVGLLRATSTDTEAEVAEAKDAAGAQEEAGAAPQPAADNAV